MIPGPGYPNFGKLTDIVSMYSSMPSYRKDSFNQRLYNYTSQGTRPNRYGPFPADQQVIYEHRQYCYNKGLSDAIEGNYGKSAEYFEDWLLCKFLDAGQSYTNGHASGMSFDDHVMNRLSQ